MNHTRSILTGKAAARQFLSTATLAIGLLMSLQTAVSAQGSRQSERHPRVEPAASQDTVGRASFILPKGWTIANREGDLAVVNPGFAETDTLEALIVVGSEALEGADVNRTITALLEVNLPNLGEYLSQVQVEVDLRRAKVTALALPKLSGAQLTLAGQSVSPSGGKLPVTVWVGTTRDAKSAASVLVVVLRGKEETYLPGARRILESLQFIADVPANLGGLEFGFSRFYDGGSTTTTYRFRDNGTVTKHRMTSTRFNTSESEVHGTYVQRGDHVTIRVDGSAEEATLERRGGNLTGLRMGNTVYDRL